MPCPAIQLSNILSCCLVPAPPPHELVHIPTTLGEGVSPVEGPSTLIVS